MSKIPVTPEMIAAGLSAHALLTDGPSVEEMWTLSDYALAAMYRAMRALEPVNTPSPPQSRVPEGEEDPG